MINEMSKEEMAQEFEKFMAKKEKIQALLQSPNEEYDLSLSEKLADIVFDDIEEIDSDYGISDILEAVQAFLILVAQTARELRWCQSYLCPPDL